MSPDPFSAILSLIEARAVCAGGFTVGGAWSIAFLPPEQLKFLVLARGQCWIAVEGMDAPFRMTEGDVLMLSAARAFVAASDLSLPPRPAREVFGAAVSGVFPVGGGEEILFLGGHVDMTAGCGALLLDSLPDVIRVEGSAPEAPRLKTLIAHLAEESAAVRLGAGFAGAALAQLIFLDVLRVCLAREGELLPGLLRVLADQRLAPAVRLMHGQPERAWRLPELASAAAMSRTAFATRFKAAAGMGPLAYLAHWRLHLARRWLAAGGMSVGEIARATGFASDAAFSNAFKRLTGVSPSRFRLDARGLAAP